jgi:hypothetical protein
MRLPVPLCKLPLRFDVGQLSREVTALEPELWINHPGGFEPSHNIILISVDGGLNDDFAIAGRMQPTKALERCGYVRQVLAALRAPISRARLTSIEGPAYLSPHEDANSHWFDRTRIHIPIISTPAVKFDVDDRSVHMAPGEAWIFDNFRKHSVVNPTSLSRVHLILDTKGSPPFWAMVKRAIAKGDRLPPTFVPWRPGARPRLSVERYRFAVPSPQQVDTLVTEILAELPDAFEGDVVETGRVSSALMSFRDSWRRVFVRHRGSASGEADYVAALEELRLLLATTELKRRVFSYGKAFGAMAVLTTVFQTTNRLVDLKGKRLA